MRTRTHLYSAIFLFLTAALILTAACTRKTVASQPFPESNQVAGWSKTGDSRTYTASNLYEYIDGDAEKYVKAGVKDAATADYKYQDKIEAVADVYTMSSVDGAKTIFDSEPAVTAATIQIGDAVHASGQSVVFRKGAHLVRIVAYQDSPETQQALVNLARGIEGRLSE